MSGCICLILDILMNFSFFLTMDLMTFVSQNKHKHVLRGCNQTSFVRRANPSYVSVSWAGLVRIGRAWPGSTKKVSDIFLNLPLEVVFSYFFLCNSFGWWYSNTGSRCGWVSECWLLLQRWFLPVAECSSEQFLPVAECSQQFLPPGSRVGNAWNVSHHPSYP